MKPTIEVEGEVYVLVKEVVPATRRIAKASFLTGWIQSAGRYEEPDMNLAEEAWAEFEKGMLKGMFRE